MQWLQSIVLKLRDLIPVNLIRITGHSFLLVAGFQVHRELLAFGAMTFVVLAIFRLHLVWVVIHLLVSDFFFNILSSGETTSLELVLVILILLIHFYKL